MLKLYCKEPQTNSLEPLGEEHFPEYIEHKKYDTLDKVEYDELWCVLSETL